MPEHLPRFEIIYQVASEGGSLACLIDHDVRQALIEECPARADNPLTGVVGWASAPSREELEKRATTFFWPHHLDMRQSFNWRR